MTLAPKPSTDDAVFLDVETFADTQYSLSSISAAAYIRDDRFDILCLAIAEGDGPINFYHKFASGDRSLDAARQRLARAADEGKWLVCHNAGFDGLILKLRSGIEFAHIFDTTFYLRYLCLGASLDNGARYLGQRKGDAPEFNEESLKDPALRKKMARYNALDVALTRLLFREAMKSELLTPLETWVMDKTARDGLRGLDIDQDWLLRTSVRFGQLRNQALESLCREFTDFNTDDLRRRTVVLEYCNTRLGGALSSLDRKAADVISAKRSNDALGNYLRTREAVLTWQRWADKAGQIAGVGPRVYMPLKYYGARTGRFAGGGRDCERLNIQNLPVGRDDAYRELEQLRGALVPDKGESWVAADLSSIEARVLALLAGEEALLERFRAGEDVYVWLARLAFPGQEINKHLRQAGKVAILGLGFGMGFDRFYEGLSALDSPISESDARRLFTLYKSTFRRIIETQEMYWRAFRSAVDARRSSMVGRCAFELVNDGTGAGVAVVLPTGRRLFFRSVQKARVVAPWGKLVTEYRYAGGYEVEAAARKKPSGAGRVVKCLDGRVRTVIYKQVLVENIVQAVARDLLVAQMHQLEEGEGYRVVFHVHDELVVATKACTCPAVDGEELGVDNHLPDCPWVEGRRIVERVMSAVPDSLSGLAGLPVGCEVSDQVRARYGK